MAIKYWTVLAEISSMKIIKSINSLMKVHKISIIQRNIRMERETKKMKPKIKSTMKELF